LLVADALAEGDEVPVVVGLLEQAATLIASFERSRTHKPGIQGSALLANAFRDPAILIRQARHLERWIDFLSS
jgi:hypothetical protein